jgi:lipoprotein NlpI
VPDWVRAEAESGNADAEYVLALAYRNGEAALAKTELQASLKKQKQDDWPEPIAEFYLDELDATHLLDRAGKDKQFAHARTCMADSYMAEWHAAQGQQDQAEALKATLRTQCAPAKP